MLFSKVEDYLNNDAQNAEHLWEKVLNIFETLLDWYDNNTIYHLLGLLVLLDENTGPAKIISKRYCFYQDHTRDAFKQDLFDVIKDILNGILCENRNGNEGLNNAQNEPLDKARILQVLSSLEYGDAKTNKKIKKLMLVYNVAVLITSKNEHERFPFNLYKKDQWDIEHINPQTPPEENRDNLKVWLECYNSLF